MGDRLCSGKPSRYVTSHLGQHSAFHPSGAGKSSSSLHRLGLRRGVFACVGWQVILCDPIWHATLLSSEMDFHLELNTALTFFKISIPFCVAVIFSGYISVWSCISPVGDSCFSPATVHTLCGMKFDCLHSQWVC